MCESRHKDRSNIVLMFTVRNITWYPNIFRGWMVPCSRCLLLFSSLQLLPLTSIQFISTPTWHCRFSPFLSARFVLPNTYLFCRFNSRKSLRARIIKPDSSSGYGSSAMHFTHGTSQDLTTKNCESGTESLIYNLKDSTQNCPGDISIYIPKFAPIFDLWRI